MKSRSDKFDQRDYDALMRSNIPSALATGDSMRFDSVDDAGAFFARELDFVKSKAYDKLYPRLTAISHFPFNTDTDAGAETVTYYSYEKTGFANIINNYATDLPRADVNGTAVTAQIKSVGISYGYSMQEMRASRFADKGLDVRKAESARWGIDSELNKIAWIGDKANGLLGVLSDGNNVPLYTLPTGESGKTAWADKTADEILTDINGMVAQVLKTTKGVEAPDTLCVPTDVYADITSRQIPNTGFTVASFILQNNQYIKEIIPAPELQSDCTEINPYAAETDGQGVAFLFTNDPDKFAIEQPLPFTQYPIQTQNLEVVVPCEARTGGVVFFYPLSALVAVGV